MMAKVQYADVIVPELQHHFKPGSTFWSSDLEREEYLKEAFFREVESERVQTPRRGWFMRWWDNWRGIETISPV
jgi:hypothetical protein